ncbi:unnamed protein product [Rhodiola kirilowii]
MKSSCSAGGFDKRNKMKKKKRMKGLFMCQSADTMVCMSHDNNGKSSSVIVPRKKKITAASSSCQSQSDDTSSSLSSTAAKYVRLVQSPSLNISNSSNKRRSSAAKQTTNHHLGEHQPTSTIASILSTPESVKDDVLQIVVMKVSIHCQGCAEKVKKHLSKMEGVTSFSIDVETKRVIVMGHVSPDWVLQSLSKVKKAELWTL